MPVRATFVAKRFAVPNKYANFALGLSHALQGGSPKGQERQAGHIHNGKGVSCALVLTHENFANSTDCQKQGNGGRPMGVYYIHSFRRFSWHLFVKRSTTGTIYTHIRGAFSVARFDNPGNAKAFLSWNE